TTAPNAAPTTTATARSTTLPRRMNALKSFSTISSSLSPREVLVHRPMGKTRPDRGWIPRSRHRRQVPTPLQVTVARSGDPGVRLWLPGPEGVVMVGLSEHLPVVLVVDDDPGMRRLVRTGLELDGAEVREAGS